MKGSLIALVLIAMAGTACEKKACKASLKPDCVCTMQYDPVCGCDNITYGNACEAECNSITDYAKGECR